MLWLDWLHDVKTLTQSEFLARHPQPALVFVSTRDGELTTSKFTDTPEKTALPSKLKKVTRLNLFRALRPENKERQSIYFLNEGMKVGRVAESDIHIPLDGISRAHAKFGSIANFGWIISDLCSRNGTFINGNKLGPGLPYVLESGSVIDFGDETTAVFLNPLELWKFVQRELELVVVR